MRTLTQPGPPLQPRRLIAWAEAGGEFRVTLAEGDDLLNGLRATLAAASVSQAAVTVSSAVFSQFSYLTGQEDASGARVATYGAPTHLEGPVQLIGANAILGSDAEGKALVHCHAVVVDRAGTVHGGHLPPGACILGAGGAVAWAAALKGSGFGVAYDSETNYPLFGPVALPQPACDGDGSEG